MVDIGKLEGQLDPRKSENMVTSLQPKTRGTALVL